MKKSGKIILITFMIIIALMLLLIIVCHLYVNKTNNLNPEETIKRYMEYWADDSTLKMKSLESKEAEFIDVIRNPHNGIKINNLSIQDETEKEIDEIVKQYNGAFLKDNLKIYRIKFYAESDMGDWNGEHTFNVRLVHEKQGWCILSLGNI